MTFTEFEAQFLLLGESPRTKAVDEFNRRLIRQGADVSFLGPLIPGHEEYFRSYFQISMGQKPTLAAKMAFVEKHFHLLQDWWHTDCLIGFLGNNPDFDYVLAKARQYVVSPLPYVRRWGYVMFIPRLVRDPGRIDRILPLLKNDNAYHVVMAQAWLISYLAMCDWEKIRQYLMDCDLRYDIVGRAIQKICDSLQIPPDIKERFRALRALRKKATAT